MESSMMVSQGQNDQEDKDPLVKREAFAISLRKEKKIKIL